jgi:hypothetical protein
VGNYGIGGRNEQGERLIQFRVENDYIIMNINLNNTLADSTTGKVQEIDLET